MTGLERCSPILVVEIEAIEIVNNTHGNFYSHLQRHCGFSFFINERCKNDEAHSILVVSQRCEVFDDLGTVPFHQASAEKCISNKPLESWDMRIPLLHLRRQSLI